MATGRKTSASIISFTLIELLTVIAITGLLASLFLPSLAAAKEKAKVTTVHAELFSLGLALDMYAMDEEGNYPPVRVNCNTDLASHWCQLPVELAEQHYVPHGKEGGMAAAMEDVFNPGHTYKYAAPGPCLVNDSPGGNFELWVPNDFPRSEDESGQYHSSPTTSPIRWVLWSMGPQPAGPKSLSSRAPLGAQTWYQGTRDHGVLVRIESREGEYYRSP